MSNYIVSISSDSLIFKNVWVAIPTLHEELKGKALGHFAMYLVAPVYYRPRRVNWQPFYRK